MHTELISVQGSTNFGEDVSEHQGHLVKTLKYLKINLIIDSPLYVFMSIYFLLGIGYLAYVDFLQQSNFLTYVKNLYPLFSSIMLLAYCAYLATYVLKRFRRRRRLAIKFLLAPRGLARVLNGMILLFGLCITLGMFTVIKASLGHVTGFQNDIWQADLDRWLFLGNDPWQILFKPVAHIWLQIIIEFNYNAIWHLMAFGVLFFVVLSNATSALRKHYFMSFMLVWLVLGNLFAGFFISAGPAFYGKVTGDELRFGEQLQLLAQFENSIAIRAQDYLWNLYERGFTGFGAGISAFPSIHVGVTVINMLFAFEKSRKLGIIATVYFIFVLWSSVFLAWHYLIDGLASLFIVAAIYYITKRLIRKPETLKAS